MEEVAPPKQQIMVSRSFGELVTRYQDLEQAVVHYVTRAAEKLRNEGLKAHSLVVFAESNRFRKEDIQYTGSRVIPLATPTQDTRKLIGAALAGLGDLYRPGILYKKAGVMLANLEDQTIHQEDLFVASDSAASKRLMAAMDSINRLQGRGTVFLAAAGVDQKRWQMRSDMKSAGYLYDWNTLKTVVA